MSVFQDYAYKSIYSIYRKMVYIQDTMYIHVCSI